MFGKTIQNHQWQREGLFPPPLDHLFLIVDNGREREGNGVCVGKKRGGQIERRVGVGRIDGAKLRMEGRMERNQGEPVETRRELVEGKVARGHGGIEKGRGEEMAGRTLVELEGNYI